MAKRRIEIFLAAIVIGVGLIATAILGLWLFMAATPPLHKTPQDVSGVRGAAEQRWAGAVEQARQVVRAAVAGQNLPGLSVAVGAGNEIVWAEGFGWADIDKRVPVAPEMKFRIGTASTALTSAAAGLLLEKGRLKLDERIQTYVPEFPEKQWPVTLRQVMAHVAGIRNDGGDEGPLFEVQCGKPLDALAYFKDSDLRFEPGTEYRFSRFGWILVSAAIEDVTNEPFLSVMRTQIFEPLGMDHTEADSDAVPDRVSFYFPRFASDPRYGPDPMRPLNYSCYAGASVFVSTASDLVRFAMAINGGTLLQPATVHMLQTSQRLSSGQETGYGLGWDLEVATVSGKPTVVVGHDGDSLGGVVGSFMTFPEQGIVVSALSNISYADTFGIAVKIAEAFAGQKTTPAAK